MKEFREYSADVKYGTSVNDSTNSSTCLSLKCDSKNDAGIGLSEIVTVKNDGKHYNMGFKGAFDLS